MSKRIHYTRRFKDDFRMPSCAALSQYWFDALLSFKWREVTCKRCLAKRKKP